LDAVSGQALARAWQQGAGPTDGPMTIDVDSTICEVYGTAKQGAEFGHTKVRGYHPLLAFAAGTWDLLHAGCAAAAPTPPAGRPGLWPRRSAGCAPPAPAGR
jgi:hypothetical protein